MESDWSDAQLIAASLDESEFFAVLFTRYGSDILRYVSRRTGRDDAAELTGEVFARAFAIRHKFDLGRESARPWLYGIATRIVGDHYRRSIVRRREARLAMRLNEPDYDPAPDIVNAVTYEEQRPVIEAALRKLSPKDHDVLLLVALSQLSLPEVAEAVSAPLGTVKSRLARARTQLRELLPADLQRTLRGEG